MDMKKYEENQLEIVRITLHSILVILIQLHTYFIYTLF